MGLLDGLFGRSAPAPVGPANDVPTANLAKIDNHIRRFTLALEQCEKGPEREAELRSNLEYWRQVKALAQTKPD